jgi:aspartate/methionine/tyrosine aminotransferase
MAIRPFLLERYFARFEFQTPYLLASSDCESMQLTDLLAMATPEQQRAWQSTRLGYAESAGHPRLRTLIAGLYPGLRESDIITAAPEEAIYLTMRTLLRPGDRIVATFPGYQSLYEIATSMGCEVVRWEPDERSDRWHFSINRLRELLDSDTRALVVNFPHNPTGAQPSAAEWDELMGLASDADVWLISDEMYRGLEDGVPALAPAATRYERAITIAGLSKAYGLAGLRMGWVACRDRRLLDRVQSYKDYTTICASPVVEQLAMIALENEAYLRERARGIIRGNMQLLRAFFRRTDDLFSPRWPVAGPVCFPRWKGPSASEMCERSATRGGVMLLPSTVYEYSDSHVRMGVGRTSFPEALEKFEEFLRLE